MMGSGELQITKLNGRIGAVISGVRLSDDVPDSTIAAIRSALVTHKVIFFRDQQHMDVATQEAFCKRFGPLQGHPFARAGEKEQGGFALKIDSATGEKTNTWHTDMTFLDAYPMASVLFGEVIPEYGGNTMWANTAAAYDYLPDGLKALADTLWAVHSNSYDYASERKDIVSERVVQKVAATAILEATHPVVRIHPESGERCLVLGTFVSHLKDYGVVDSRALYDLFMRHMTRAENVARWAWRQGDVAMWDNRATLHYGVMDFGEQHRIVRRVTIAGDVPVSVDGQSSTMVTKQARSETL
jgi:taurine dioxygenase